MNYLAHGFRFLSQPAFTAGTAVPDWLSVVDRRVRVRRRRLAAELPTLSQNQDAEQMVRGMLQHLDDDDRFHRSETFLTLESELGVRFRRIMPEPYDHRPGFLGHIVCELMLDATLAERHPELTGEYYRVLAAVAPDTVQAVVNQVATRTTEDLSAFVEHFLRSRFLYDYLQDVSLLGRLNQVLRRVTLPALDEGCLPVLRDARLLLRQSADDLLQAVFPESQESDR